MNCVPQLSVLGPALFGIFVSDVDSGIECTLGRFAEETELHGVVNTLEGRDAIQRDLDRTERWAWENLMRFNKAKCKGLHLGWDDPKHKHKLGGEWIESSPGEKDLGMLVDKKLDKSQRCALAAQKANCTLHQKQHGKQGDGGDCPLCSALMRPHLESCFQLWGPQHKKDVDLLEQVQRRATEMMKVLEHISNKG